MARVKSNTTSSNRPSKKVAVADGHIQEFKKRLHRRNRWLAIGYGIQAIALALSAGNLSVPVQAHFWNMQYQSASHQLFAISLGQMLALALILSAAMHGLLAYYGTDSYAQNLTKGSNSLRWMDGAFSGSLLSVAVCLTAGVTDSVALLAVLVLGVVAHLLGLFTELYNQPYKVDQPAVDNKPFVLMIVCAATAWLIPGISLMYAATYNDGILPFAWLIYTMALAFVTTTGYVLVRNYQRFGRWANYATTETAFVWLSFVAKSTIAWSIVAVGIHR